MKICSKPRGNDRIEYAWCVTIAGNHTGLRFQIEPDDYQRLHPGDRVAFIGSRGCVAQARITDMNFGDMSIGLDHVSGDLGAVEQTDRMIPWIVREVRP